MADQLQEILEIVQFIKDHGASKDDLKDYTTKEDLKSFEERANERFATKEDIASINERLDYHSALLVTIQQDLADVKTSLAELEKKWKEESEACGKDLTALKERVNVLEQGVCRLQSAGSVS